MYNIGFELFFYICHYRVYGLEVVPKLSTRCYKHKHYLIYKPSNGLLICSMQDIVNSNGQVYLTV